MASDVIDTQRRAVRLLLRGRVQGLGVRPAIARLADRLGLCGGVRNTLAGLEIEVEGDADGIEAFRRELRVGLPRGCVVRQIDEAPIAISGRDRFSILRDDAEGPLSTAVPADVVACRSCLSEVADATNRRYRYPLTSCAACGPRYTVIRRMPYERGDTAMAEFAMCSACEREYRSSDDRRFHAQTIACAACGPQVWAVDQVGRALGRGDQALERAVAALREGRIVALRGIGGYQLLCDATSDEAVQRLRLRKNRPTKPLAVLVGTVDAARRLASFGKTERDALASSAGPIVLAKARGDAGLARAIGPDLDTVGLMLPTTPLHDFVARVARRPLVCTSGNREGEPLEYEVAAVEERLAGVADVWVHHNRPIERPIDDSVVRVIAGRVVTLRLARGMAPLALGLSAEEPTLALGGHLKVAAAWSSGAQCVLGPHVGDLGTLAARQRFVSELRDWQSLYRFTPCRLVRDLHPDYFTSRFAEEQSLATLGVQHHFAHVAAGMLEHDLLDQEVLGVAWDGTGFGTDGTIWGGEFLVADGVKGFHRVAHVRPFGLGGGEAAVREPWRVAVAVLAQALGREQLVRDGLGVVGRNRLGELLQVLDRPRFTTATTSMGRLFDAAASIILSIAEVQYEGEAAMRLEAVADRTIAGCYPLPLSPGEPPQLDWRPLFAALWADRQAGGSPASMAMRFHRALAAGLVTVARRFADLPIVLGGGVFQNRLLTELVVELLDGSERLKLPGRIPPNDGGLAAGQLAVAVVGGQREAQRASGPFSEEP